MVVRRVAVLVPGVLGSALRYSGGSSPTTLWDTDLRANYQRLISNAPLLAWHGKRADAAFLDSIQFSTILPFLKRDLWKKTVDCLEAMPAFTTGGIRRFAYDWRASLVETAPLFADLIQSEADGPVQEAPADGCSTRFALITHSMGGLLLRIAIGLKLLHPGWLDRIVHFGTPLRGSPAAFRTVFGRLELPLIHDLLCLYRGKNQDTYLRSLRDCFRTFPSIYQLFPRAEDPFLYYDHLARSNPLDEAVLEDVYRDHATAAHDALDAADDIFRDTNVRTDLVFTETHLYTRTELEYRVAVSTEPRLTYSVLAVHAASDAGDGTVPAYSARRSLGDVHRHPVIGVDHGTMCNAERATSLLSGIL